MKCERCAATENLIKYGFNRGRQRYICQICNRGDQLKKLYGVSVLEFDAQLQSQNGLCAICRRALMITFEDRLHPLKAVVDHDHETGAVRGIICAACNRCLGILDEDIPTIHAFAEGVEEYMLNPPWRENTWEQLELDLENYVT